MFPLSIFIPSISQRAEQSMGVARRTNGIATIKVEWMALLIPPPFESG